MNSSPALQDENKIMLIAHGRLPQIKDKSRSAQADNKDAGYYTRIAGDNNLW